MTNETFDLIFTGVLALTAVITATALLIASVVRGLDPVSAAAAFGVLAAAKYVMRR